MRVYLFTVVLLCGFSRPVHADFDKFLKNFRAEAVTAGVSAAVADAALGNVSYDPKIIELDRKQPEKRKKFSTYLAGAVTEKRVTTGQEYQVQYGPLLQEISEKYHVPQEIILALWGMETSYGENMGGFQTIDALATLAYDGRRAAFFHQELIAALYILQEENMAAEGLEGSWAGAMGQCQFMPSTYLKYAVDYDKNGHADIWNSTSDAFASIANYLHGLGWNPQEIWGVAVSAPPHLTPQDLKTAKPRRVAEWLADGVQFAGNHLNPKTKSWLIKPEGARYSYLVTENYKRLMEWNRSIYFATAVGILSDRIAQE